MQSFAYERCFAVTAVDCSLLHYCFFWYRCWLVFLPFTFGAIPYKTTLLLDKEEVTKTDITLCGKVESKRPYGELGSVDRSNCFCCVGVESAFGPISPGCGCEAAKVDDVVVELKGRMRTRGDTAQIQRAEQTLQRLDEVDAKLVSSIFVAWDDCIIYR
jgi:hypothetical protein